MRRAMPLHCLPKESNAKVSEPEPSKKQGVRKHIHITMEQQKQWTALERSVLKLIIFMNPEKAQPAREAESRYNTQDASLPWKPGGF